MSRFALVFDLLPKTHKLMLQCALENYYYNTARSNYSDGSGEDSLEQEVVGNIGTQIQAHSSVSPLVLDASSLLVACSGWSMMEKKMTIEALEEFYYITREECSDGSGSASREQQAVEELQTVFALA